MSVDAVEAAPPSRTFRAGWGWLLLSAASRGYLVFVLSLTACAVLPVFSGFSGSVVQSGSMEPNISPGDVVVSQPMPAHAAPPMGRVVTFPAPEGSAKSGLMLHRVVGANKDGSLVTAGDANADVDSTPLDPKDIVSRGRALVPWIGLPSFWVRTGSFLPMLLWALLTAAALGIEAAAVSSRTPPKDPEDPKRPPGDIDTAPPPPHRHWESVLASFERIRTFAHPSAVACIAIVTITALAMIPLGQSIASFSARTSTNDNSWTVEGPPTKLAFTAGPSDSTGGVPFGTQPVVALQNADDRTIISSVAPVTLAITNPAGSTLTCASNPKTSASGVATFAGCKIDKPGTYTLRATSGSLTAATSASFTVTTGPAAKLAFTTSPSNTTINTFFSTQPAVTVQDAGGNTVTASASPVTLSITTPAGAVLNCTVNPRDAVSGVVAFAGCKIDKTGTYTMSATSGALTTGTSATFTITDNPLGIFTANQDIGSPGVAGSSAYSAGTYTVKGGGTDIGSISDKFQFLDRPMTGNGRLTARVVSQSQTIPNAAAEAGVMFRETLAAGSIHGMVDVTRSSGSEFHWRLATGGLSGATTVTPGIAAPYWVRLTRVGNVLTGERSINGTTWVQQGATQTVTMTSAINVGLAVSAANNSSLNTAVFDSVKLTTPPTAVAESYSTNEDTTLTIPASGVLGNDTDAESDNLTAVLVSTTSGLTLNANGSFSYVPPAGFSGAASFTYKANDGVFDSNTVTVSLTVNPVNDAPSFTKGANQTVSQNATAQSIPLWATAISQGTGDSGQIVDFLVTNTNNPLFSVQPKISATGTLTYTPAAGATGVTTVSASIHDNGGTANGGVDTSAIQTFTITVDAPPVVATTGTSLAYTENATTVVDTGVTVSDADSANLTSATVKITTNYVNGQDTLAFTTQNGITGTWTAATGVLALSGSATVANYQTALRSITYANSSNTPTTTTRTVSLTASDGTTVSTAATRNITVTAVNDAPVNSVPAAQSTVKNIVEVFSGANGNLISISDVDASTGSMQVQLVSTNGKATLSTITGLAFTVGDGTADAAMTFTGTITAINTALAGMSFNPTTGFTGAASFQIITGDQGNTGSGGAQSDSDTIAITVRSNFSSDTFTDSTGVLLHNHTGDYDATWTKHFVSSTDVVITPAGRIRKSGTSSAGASYYSSAVPASANYTVEADVFVASLLANDNAGVVGRVGTGFQSTGYLATYDRSVGKWALASVVNSNMTELGTFTQALAAGSTYRLTLDMNSTTIRLLVDGVPRVSVTNNTAITTAGRGGIYLGFGAGDTTVTDTTGMHLDNFTMTPP